MDVTLKWGDWPEEFRSNNYLCVKENALYEQTELVVR